MPLVSGHTRANPISWFIALFFLGFLFFVWPIPGTIALRNILLGSLLLLLSVVNIRLGGSATAASGERRSVLFVYGVLTLWLALVIAGWGVEPSLNWQEFRGQWLVSSACALAGVLFARWAIIQSAASVQQVLKVVFYVFMAQICLHDLLDAYFYIATDTVPFRQAPVLYLPAMIKGFWSGEPLINSFLGLYVEKFSYVNNTFAAFLIAEICQRCLTGKRWLNISSWVLVVGLCVVMLSSYWMSVRNGNIGLLSLILMSGLMIVLRYRHRIGGYKALGVGLVSLVLVGSLAHSFWKTDPRWQTLAETVPIALDTETNKAWISSDIYPYPRLSNGEQVSPSNYERIAWIKEGVKMSLDHPMGTGYDRNAFFDGLDRQLEMNGQLRGGFSHSGVVDFVIANGYPGLILWLVLLWLLVLQGWRTFRGPDMALGLMLAFVVGGFCFRSFLDSTIKDHMLQQFAFVAALLSTLCGSRTFVDAGSPAEVGN